MSNSNSTIPLNQRRKIFLKLHGKLAKKYKDKYPNLGMREIGFIRRFSISLNQSQQEVLETTDKMISKTHEKRNNPLSFYENVFMLVKKITPEDWKILTTHILFSENQDVNVDLIDDLIDQIEFKK